jgi:hypothetical protein
MAIQKRLAFVAIIFFFALALYGTGKYYSTPMVIYIVEQSLEQKAPEGMDSAQIRKRLHRFLNSAPDKKMERLFKISGYLEKVQRLTSEELNKLMPMGNTEILPAP